MELRYPFLFLITLLSLLIFLFFNKRKKQEFHRGSKIANTHYLKESFLYQQLLKKYKVLVNLVKLFCLLAILCCSLLLSRPSSVRSINNNQYNRDIFLCMDVSSSVDELNRELVESLKNTVNLLKGERFGISIFNTSSVVLVPLTDDYDYVLDVLDKIKRSIDINNTLSFENKDNDYYTLKNYIISGTGEGAETQGSSLIGDGLASCVYSFSNLEEERSRMIIFSTDNDLAGDPLVTLKEASNISKSKKIKVFGIGTKEMSETKKQEFKSAVLSTDGKFYEHSIETVTDIVKDIDKVSKSLLDNDIVVKKIDIPFFPFLLFLFFTTLFLILDRRIKS